MSATDVMKELETLNASNADAVNKLDKMYLTMHELIRTINPNPKVQEHLKFATSKLYVAKSDLVVSKKALLSNMPSNKKKEFHNTYFKKSNKFIDEAKNHLKQAIELSHSEEMNPNGTSGGRRKRTHHARSQRKRSQHKRTHRRRTHRRRTHRK